MSETKKLPERLTRQLAAKGVDDAKDRAVKRSGGAPSDYTYDAKTNAARKK